MKNMKNMKNGKDMWSKSILKHGYELAIDINAKIFVIFTESGRTYDIFKELPLEKSENLKIIIATPNKDTYFKLNNEKGIIPILMNFRNKHKSIMINQCIAKLLENNLVKKDDIIVSIYGLLKDICGTDTISLNKVGKSSPILKFYQYVGTLDASTGRVLTELLNIAMELGVEGREGQPVGTIFVVGDTEKVLTMSSQLILNPFKHHDAIIFDAKVRGTIKELSTIDGAFIINEKGKVVSAGRYIDCTCGHIIIPSGLGARHYAAAAISKHTKAIAIVVSESGGVIRVFKEGKIFVKLKSV